MCERRGETAQKGCALYPNFKGRMTTCHQIHCVISTCRSRGFDLHSNSDCLLIIIFINLPLQVNHPRFIVFPAPLGFASVNTAHFSSFCRFSSSLSHPATVPSASASIANCSEVVGPSPEAALESHTRQFNLTAWGKRRDSPPRQ